MKLKEIKQHTGFSVFIVIALLISDIGSYFLSYYLLLFFLNLSSIIEYPLIIVAGIISLFYFFGRYNPSSLQSRVQELKIIINLTLINTFCYLMYKMIFKVTTIAQSQNIVILSLLFLFIVLMTRLFIRTIQKHLLKVGVGLRNAMIIGSNKSSINFLNKIIKRKYSGYRILAYFDYSDKNNHDHLKDISKKFNFPNYALEDINEIENFILTNHIHEVIINLSQKEDIILFELISKLRNLDVCIKIVPNIYDVLTGYAKMHSVTGMPLIDINPNILTEFQFFLKRIIDILGAVFGLFIASPLFLIIAIIIKSTSKGKVIFKQERIGLNGRPFMVHKFRTMHSDSEEKTGPVWASKNDPRITRFGNILRKSRLDEFPQLYNVLIGNMSIVGPRPERDFFISQLKEKFPYYVRRLNVRPGITGWAQIMGSYDTDIENVKHKLKLDFYYIENISIWLDIKIMIITVWVILRGKGQ